MNSVIPVKRILIIFGPVPFSSLCLKVLTVTLIGLILLSEGCVAINWIVSLSRKVVLDNLVNLISCPWYQGTAVPSPGPKTVEIHSYSCNLSLTSTWSAVILKSTLRFDVFKTLPFVTAISSHTGSWLAGCFNSWIWLDVFLTATFLPLFFFWSFSFFLSATTSSSSSSGTFFFFGVYLSAVIVSPPD